MEKKKELPYIDEETYSTDLNDYTNFTTVPEYQAPVHYEDFFKDSVNTQKIISLRDIAVSNLVRKNSNGEIEFALIETTVPATFGRDGYYGTLLEVPFFSLPTKKTLAYKEILSILDDSILDLNLYMEGNSVLDDNKTPIHQSFTNQCGQFYLSSVSELKGGSDSKLHWFPISSLSSYIKLQLDGGMDNVHSSLQSLYALKLLERKYKADLDKIQPTPFKLDKEVPRLELLNKKQVVNNSPRFTIVDVKYKTPDGEIHYSTYADSKDSIEAVLLAENETKRGQYDLIVSKQQRSPYVTNENFSDGILNEFTGGGLEEGQTFEDAAIAEAGQEQTFCLDKENLVLLYKSFINSLSSSEFGFIFMSIVDKNKRTKQKLDEGKHGNSAETISSNQEYLSLDEVANNMHLIDPAPVCAKLGVLLVDSYMREREQEKMKNDLSDNER